tara:strand:+ start:335 stop:2269 length:1935 start_codon:yes stop_codon:yes gene_type:complete
MSLKNILFGIGKKVFGKKPQPSPATGKQQGLITYEKKNLQSTGKDLATQDLKNPPVVLKKTKPLHMGDKTPPAFGSSTYDWIMKKGSGKFTADEWVDHLTSTRKETFKLWGKPATRTVRDTKRFKYDSGEFQGKEVTVGKEELFDSNLAVFNELGDLTGGLLYAAKKFGLKLDANELGAMVKLNPINRLKPMELGVPKGAMEALETQVKTAGEQIKGLSKKYAGRSESVKDELDSLSYHLKGVTGRGSNEQLINSTDDFMSSIKDIRKMSDVLPEDKKILNQIMGNLDARVAPVKGAKTRYANETSYTLQGGKDYRETIFYLDEPIASNSNPLKTGGHFSDTGAKNQIYHVRYDTRFTPDNKKVFMINEIQSDVNQPIAKALSKMQQLGGEKRVNPFQADIEMNLLANNRSKLMAEMNEAVAKNQPLKARAIGKEVSEIQRKLNSVFQKRGSSGEGRMDYFPMVEADQYGDHALKYLVQKAAREGVDYVAVAPFNKLSFRQGYKAGNERFYGYATGKGIDQKGKAVMPELMKKLSRFYNTKAGPTKISLSDPKMPYKTVKKDKFKYPDKSAKKGKEISSDYHERAEANPFTGSKLIPTGDPRLYFDAFAIKVEPLMKLTQKTYKAKGGLVVDMFKPMRYNTLWL